MAKINENKLAVTVAACEAGRVQVSIAQVKEVVKCTLITLATDYRRSEVVALLEKHSGEGE